MEFSMIIWLIFTLDQSIYCSKVYGKQGDKNVYK